MNNKSVDELVKEIKELRQQVNELKLYKHVLDQLPVCTIVYDESEKVIYRNKASVPIDGYNNDELLGFTRLEYLKHLNIKHGRTTKRVFLPPSTGQYQEGIFGFNETTIQGKDGITRPVLLNGSYIYNENNDLIGACGCAINLTEYDRKEKMYQLLVETLPIPVFIKDKDGFYQGCNAAFEKFTGLTREKIIGKTGDLWPQEVTAITRRTDNELYQRPGSLSYEIKLTHADGTQRDVIFNKATYAQSIDDHTVDGLVGVMTDITERRNLEKEMARLDRLNLIGEMAASIGHEVRNPMTTVRGFLQLLKDKAEYTAYKNYFNLMIEELDRANSIISEYLSLAKDKRADRKALNLNNIIETVNPLIQAEFLEANNNLTLDLKDIPCVLMDEGEMRQLLLNLVRNGLEAMEPGGSMKIGTFVDNDDVVLYIKDAGSGIAPAILEKLGSPFLTTKANGTGLGLAVCYSIAARHNAKIDVKTNPSGTTFFVRFKATHHQA